MENIGFKSLNVFKTLYQDPDIPPRDLMRKTGINDIDLGIIMWYLNECHMLPEPDGISRKIIDVLASTYWMTMAELAERVYEDVSDVDFIATTMEHIGIVEITLPPRDGNIMKDSMVRLSSSEWGEYPYWYIRGR